MPTRIERSAWSEVEADWLIVGVPEASEPSAALTELDERLDGQLRRLREMGDLTGKLAELVPLRDVSGLQARRLMLVGLGRSDELNVARFEKALMTAARAVSDKKDVRLAVALPEAENLTTADAARTAAAAAAVAGVGQDLYRRERGRFPFQSVTLAVPPGADEQDIRTAVERGDVLGEAVNLTRELVNRPPADIYPETFARRAEEEAARIGLACEVFDERWLADERMGALLAVARGSDNPPRLVALEHRGAGEQAPVLALCGKGVTFDSGGLSLKSSENMQTMKCDMAGAATVLGAMTAITRLKLPVNVLGLMGLVENMPSGRAFKLGDVLTARNGVTVEVLNTDAEGRLVLADVLSYALDRGAAKLIDLATLTGACVVALGEDVTGVFANDQAWCDAVLAAARRCGEDAWPMPMFDLYGELIKSDVADIKNIGGRWGGAITAAKFLERFVDGRPWVHLDIAGPSFASSGKPHREGGATGVMVRTLVETAERFAAG